jgi:glutamyl-tRNA synthetase
LNFHSKFYLAEDIEYDEKARTKFLNEKSLSYLIDVREELTRLDNFVAQELEKVFGTIVEKYHIKLGNLAQPVRVAVTGKAESPGIFEVLEILGAEKTLKRLEKAIEIIG